MAAKTPIRTVFDGDGVATGLAEFQSGEFVALAHGGIGASLSIGSAGQVLKVNSGASALEFGGVEAVINIDGMTDGSSATLATSDKIPFSDGGTEKYMEVSTLNTFFLSNTQTLTNKTLTAPTITGTAVMAALDISGDVDVDGTLETDALTIDGATIAETIADTVGAMVGSNTETGIAVTYEDGDNTLDFVLGAAQTTISTIYNTGLRIGYAAGDASIAFGTDNQIAMYIDGTSQLILKDGQLHPTTDSDVDLGKSNKYFKDAFIDTITTTGNTTIGGNLIVTGDYTVNGDTTTVNTATLSVEDPLIIMASGNNAADSVDIGLYGLYDTSGSLDLYAGLFRDASDSGKWKLFKDNQAAPTTTVNTSGTGYAVGTLVANLEGAVTGAVTGNATTATALATGRTIASTGDVVWTSASFDGSGNVTGTAAIGSGVVVNADVNASAAIDATKIADGSVTSAEFQYINTLSSNAQTQLDTKATKGFSIAMGVALG